MSSFIPSRKTARDFRDALGLFGTGVTIVTVATPQGAMGITANSFASVSLDPPLVLWSPANASKRAVHFIHAEHYAIHILAKDQQELSGRFAKTPHAFEPHLYSECKNGVPLIEGCLARFECRRHAIHEGGDHTIVVGEVERVNVGAGAPLLFHGGHFGTILPDA
ncbi:MULTISPECIES: flavin reductase family protein [Falsihalocynthiibacter]|uniref:flavin reductase family protein n=1 Tax=Falsihalocynthiibacter TaxID=2854182 RepID=UPI0030033D69